MAYMPEDMVPSQCRMARAALKMGVRELAAIAMVSTNTITRFEQDEPLRQRTVIAIQQALEANGAVLINVDADGGPGVRLAPWYSEEFREAMKVGLQPPSPVHISDASVSLELLTKLGKLEVDIDRVALDSIFGTFEDRELERFILENMAAFAKVVARLYLDKKNNFDTLFGSNLIRLGEAELRGIGLVMRHHDWPDGAWRE